MVRTYCVVSGATGLSSSSVQPATSSNEINTRKNNLFMTPPENVSNTINNNQTRNFEVPPLVPPYFVGGDGLNLLNPRNLLFIPPSPGCRPELFIGSPLR